MRSPPNRVKSTGQGARELAIAGFSGAANWIGTTRSQLVSGSPMEAGGAALGIYAMVLFGLVGGPAEGGFVALSDDAFVVRAGTCTAEQLGNGAEAIAENDGTMSGLSVASEPGLTTDALAKTVPNISSYGKYGWTTVGEVRAAGGNVRIPWGWRTVGNPFHAELHGLTPDEAAKLFRVVSNPWKLR